MIHLRYLSQPPLNGADDTVEIIGVTRNVLDSDVNEAPSCLIGIAIGCVAALAAGRLLASQLWGVSPYDPLSFAVVIALLLVVGFQACLWPARRAARVDPMVSLRQS